MCRWGVGGLNRDRLTSPKVGKMLGSTCGSGLKRHRKHTSTLSAAGLSEKRRERASTKGLTLEKPAGTTKRTFDGGSAGPTGTIQERNPPPQKAPRSSPEAPHLRPRSLRYPVLSARRAVHASRTSAGIGLKLAVTLWLLQQKPLLRCEAAPGGGMAGGGGGCLLSLGLQCLPATFLGR